MTEKQEFSTYNIPTSHLDDLVYDTPLLIPRSNGEYTPMYLTGEAEEKAVRESFDENNHAVTTEDYLVQVYDKEVKTTDKGDEFHDSKWVLASTLTKDAQERLRAELGVKVVEGEVPASEEVQRHDESVRAISTKAVQSAAADYPQFFSR